MMHSYDCKFEIFILLQLRMIISNLQSNEYIMLDIHLHLRYIIVQQQ